MITKPVDLIVANVMHGAVESISDIKRQNSMFQVLGAPSTPLDQALVRDAVARKLLCSIAHEAALDVVLTALKACGAPCSMDDVEVGLQAVRDRQGVI